MNNSGFKRKKLQKLVLQMFDEVGKSLHTFLDLEDTNVLVRNVVNTNFDNRTLQLHKTTFLKT